MSVAVIGDGGTLAGSEVEPALRRLADALARSIGAPVRALRLGPGFDLPDAVDAVVLAHTRPGHAWRSPVGVPVVADRDATAVVLVARLLATLAAEGRTPRCGVVVIAGASACPELGPLLLAAGVRDITLWNEADGRAFPLRRIASRAHAVLDLTGAAGAPVPPREAAPGGLSVIGAGGEADLLLVLPGLLDALRRVPGAAVDADVLLAAVLALVMATPPDRRLPVGPSPELSARVADAVIRSLLPTD
ncbi:hypothetical protein [Saccharothrix australiensis]|uniref:Malate dehydrogenase (Oxaloacetate-decarboxylating) n=1 Tax=Saccharothrix australiensis TaxID=2072 RepID=A0A495VWW3_9PSEU|nr:hypothetical protein [Saccharothrix australiensis]RKT52855.1 hypothetical protein C8E97_1394 [Saccharothrix australiensis]